MDFERRLFILIREVILFFVFITLFIIGFNVDLGIRVVRTLGRFSRTWKTINRMDFYDVFT